jgi:hypothetical protein
VVAGAAETGVAPSANSKAEMTKTDERGNLFIAPPV